MLTNNQELYKQLQSTVQNLYVEIQAIYEPGTNTACPEWYCAAVDLFRSGMTFRLYFTVDEDRAIKVEEVSRWWMG